MFRLPLLLACLLLLAACKESDRTVPTLIDPATPGPVAAAVTDSISLQWQRHAAHGGRVHDIARRGNTVFATQDWEVWRLDLDLESPDWQRLETTGQEFVTTADGQIYTNGGYRLGAGSHEWEPVDFGERLWLGEDGRTLFRSGDGNDVLVSHDNGGTWEVLASTPAVFYSLAQFKGDLYAAVSGGPDRDKRGIWRLESASSWQRVSPDDFFSELVNFDDQALLATSASQLYWSNDGENWQEAVPGDGSLSNPSIAGTAADGSPLIGDWQKAYLFTQDGKLLPVIDIPDAAHVSSLTVLDDDRYLVGSSTGIWLVPVDDEQESELIGVPGDRISRVFHLIDGTYAAAGSGPGYAHLARLDPVSGSWAREVLREFHVVDIAELPGGDRLLATAWAYEGGYGSLFRWRSDGSIDGLIDTGAVASVTVLENGDWMIATGDSMEGDSYEVLHSPDEGTSWSVSRHDAGGPMSLVTSCGDTFAAGPGGFHVFDAAGNEWSRLLNEDFGIISATANDRRMLVHSTSRLWKRERCSGKFEPVPLPENIELVAVALDGDGGIWATTGTGGIYLAPGEEEWKWFSEELPEGELRHVSVDANGTVWVRVMGEGILSGDRV